VKYRKKWLRKAKVKARSGAELRSATFAIFEAGLGILFTGTGQETGILKFGPKGKQETGQVFFGSIFQTGNRTGL